MSWLSPDWQISCAAVLALAVTGFSIKWVAAARMRRPPEGWRPFVLSPLLAPTSFARSRPLSDGPKLLGKTAFLLGGLVLSYWLWWRFLPRRNPRP